MVKGGNGLKLHLGCHEHVVPGWENIDKTPNVYLSRIPAIRRALRKIGVLMPQHEAVSIPPGAIRADVTRGLAYPDKSASFIYTSHMIEHMSRWRALNLVRECHRVLAPDGVLRIATPDLARWVDEYIAHDTRLAATPGDSFVTKLGMYREPQGTYAQRLIRRFISAAYHQWLYDLDSLTYLLHEAGFTQCTAHEYRKGGVPDLPLLEHRADSIFVEARP